MIGIYISNMVIVHSDAAMLKYQRVWYVIVMFSI